ncbi:MAG: hypothetical protein IT262_07400 [Saprospiraceae bacterium]|nr:hypothetical protein [Saprospiraceae bacterium]
MQNQLLHIKGALPKYLLAAALLLSSLAFSGYTGNSKCSPERTEQAELSRQKSKPLQKVVSYKKAFVYFAACRPRYPYLQYHKIARSVFDRLIKVRLFACKKEAFSFIKTAYFTQFKTIPSAQDEEDFML